MTDQCYDDEHDRGREPEPVPGMNFTYSYPIYSLEWYRDNATVYRNTAAKLELAKNALKEIADKAPIVDYGIWVWAGQIAREALEKLED
jgi:hypothetical protein